MRGIASIIGKEAVTEQPRRGPKPLLAEKGKGNGEITLLWFFIVGPMVALAAAVPVFWGWGLGWHDVVLGAVFYVIAGLGVTAGFHRYFTHGAYKAKRWLEITMAVAACLSLEMPPTGWVAEHRRHHQFSDEENDPHSPWRFGTTKRALTKGFVYSHMGWLFNKERTNPERFAPDLLKDPAMVWLDKHYGYIVASSFLLPTLIGGLWSWSWQGAVTAFFWAGLVRVSLLHHVTFSINSICHMVGDRPFDSGDKAANFTAGDPQLRRVVAQLTPHRPELCSSRRSEGTNRHHREIDLDLREAGAGPGTSNGPGWTSSNPSVWHPPRPFSTKPGERRGG